MIFFDLFVYGRTKTRDYRWLLCPVAPLQMSFFAKTLEHNSAMLSGNRKLFVSESRPDLCVFAVFFLSKSEVDERGRPIQFSIGLTSDPKFAREFNYRLPALIAGADNFIASVAEKISVAVLNDSDLDPISIDSSQLKPLASMRQMQHITTIYSEQCLSHYGGASAGRFLNDSNLLNAESNTHQDSVCGDMIQYSENLLSQIDTPSILANYDTKPVGQICGSNLDHRKNLSDVAGDSGRGSDSRDDSVSLLQQVNAFVAKDGRSCDPCFRSTGGSASLPSQNQSSSGFFNSIGTMLGTCLGSKKRREKESTE